MPGARPVHGARFRRRAVAGELVGLGDEPGGIVAVRWRLHQEPTTAREQNRREKRHPEEPHAASPRRGSRTLNRVPAPGVDSACTAPPWASTMLFTMARPSPE